MARTPRTPTLPELLRSARTARGLTLAEVAEAEGVNLTAVHHWEMGRRTPRPHRLIRLAKRLHIDAGVMMRALARG